MSSIPQIIEEVCKEMHFQMVETVFGSAGVDAAFAVMKTVKSLYRHVEPERIGGRVIVFRTVEPPGTAPAPPPVEAAANFGGFANLTITDLIVEVASDGRPYSRTLVDRTVENLARTAVVYHWQAGQEEFLAGAQRKAVPRYDLAARSQFAIPTFSNLREALQHYAAENVRESTCYIFKQVWHDDNRLFFRAGPEDTMRQSLIQFLQGRIGGDHDIWPEQNVNETRPVDIRVKPRFSNNRLMLIEIKWLGCSVAPDGHVTASHKNRRAQEGADQLAQYLDDQRQFAPTSVIQGYYVIIDGRREDLHVGATTICHADGFYYEDRELTFDPPHHEIRRDFDPPYRMFARPICAD